MKELKTRAKSFLSFFLLLALTAAVALFAIGCNGKDGGEDATTLYDPTTEAASVAGEGKTEFSFVVVTKDGNAKAFTVKTDKTTVGAALIDAGIVKGENGQFGLYVTDVDGEHHKYEEDGYYWAFYENGKYALAGVDSTEIKPDTEYMLKAEKG